ncbi:MAG: hypothetical protein ACOCV1_01490 [Bacillota bacterium]
MEDINLSQIPALCVLVVFIPIFLHILLFGKENLIEGVLFGLIFGICFTICMIILTKEGSKKCKN